MVKKTLELFVDTNLFFECKRLEDLPWSDLGADKIILVVTRPVLAEIDKHKKAGGRTKKRALEIYGRVRAMIKDGREEDVVSAENPKVVFRLARGLKFDPDLEDDLDKTATDDWLVGALSLRLKDEPGVTACLFTHDSGPASAASSLGLPYRLIDDVWLRPPENDAQEKRIIALEKELGDYRAQEPHIAITLDGYATPPKSIEIKHAVYRPLSDDELETLAGELTRRYPMAMDFDKAVDALRAISNSKDVKVEPPSEDQIAQYRDTDYPDWLAACRKTFENLHESLAPPRARHSLTYVMTNKGARPAKHARVTFAAEGDLWLYRFHRDDEENEDETKSEMSPPSLDRPPAAPMPKTIHMQPSAIFDQIDAPHLKAARDAFTAHQGMLDAVTGLQKTAALSAAAGAAVNAATGPDRSFLPIDRTPYLSHLPAALRNGYNPEIFYYDDWPSAVPVQSGALDCELWRHRAGEELFDIEIDFGDDSAGTGAVMCEVHAENLTTPATCLIRFERVIEELSLFDHAMGMIEALTPPKRKRRRRSRFKINVVDKPKTNDGDNAEP